MPELTVSVSELNEYVRGKLHMDPMLRSVRVKGEIGDYKVQLGSGHAYFTLKDDSSVISCTMWRSNVSLLRFIPKAGKKVVAKGQVTLYIAGGKYQLLVDSMSEEGIGDLFAKYEQLKNKLQIEGLFDPIHKQPLPLKIKTLGVATSLSGAAIRDIIKVARARNPLIDIIIAPCAVQGKGSEIEISRAIDALDKDGRADVILVGRGGGSMEDLWAFNEEEVARAIFRCSKPVISCVGHETDFSIADFVADLRASTPSNAAEIAVADVKALNANIMSLQKRLDMSVFASYDRRREKLNNLASSKVFTNPASMLTDGRKTRLNELVYRLANSESNLLSSRKERLSSLSRILKTLDPANTLKRGYTIVKNGNHVVSSVEQVNAGQKISVMLRDGEFIADIDTIRRKVNA